MPNAFISLREYLREPQPVVPESCADVLELQDSPDLTDAIAAARRFYVAVTETVERTTERLLHDLACEVLGRELFLSPIDTANILRRLLAETERETIACIHVHPDDVTCASDLEIPVVSDVTLCRGDVLLQLHDGVLDARLGARLEHVLRTAGAV